MSDILTRLQSLRPFSNGPKLVFPEEGKSFTIQELLFVLGQFHTFLKEKDIKPGEIVAVMSGNNSGMAIAILGIVTYGSIFMPLNPSLTKTEKQKLLSHANPRLLLVQTENDKEVWSSSCQLPFQGKKIEHDTVSILRPGSSGGFLNYTSGTTGMPKGILLSETQAIYNLDEVQKIVKKDHDHVAACFLPLFHMFGVASDLLLTILNGGKVIVLPEFDLARVPAIVRAIREYGINTFSAVPLMYDLFIRMNAGIPYSQLSLCISGGAPLREELRTTFYNKFGTEIVPAYGVTEAVCFCICSLPGSVVPGTAGKPVGIDIAIINDAGEELPFKEKGELIMHGPSVITSGYYEDNRECYITIRGKKWFRTGDLGWRDVEGNFYITGRLKNMVIKGGSKIYLEDIDGLLKEHPRIMDAASLRLENSGTTEIEQFVTFISVNDKSDSEITEKWVRDYIADVLGRQKLPDRIAIIDNIPRTITGKIKYQQLVNLMFENGF